MKNEKHDGEILLEIIEKMGMDSTAFGMFAVFNQKMLLDAAKSFNLTDKEKQVLNDRLNLLK